MLLNRNTDMPHHLKLDLGREGTFVDLLEGQRFLTEKGALPVTLQPLEGKLLLATA